MKLIFTLIVAILAIDESISIIISSNYMCIREQNRCEGFYDTAYKYNIKCEKKACEGKLNYECGSDYCALNQYLCETVSNVIYMLRSHRGMLLPRKEVKKYTNFIEKISYCAVTEYSLQSDDVCINDDGCHSVSVFSFGSIGAKVTKPINCPCPAKHTFQCGEKFCVVHSDACEAFNKTGSSFNIKNCGNGNQLLKKKLFFF